MTELELTKAKLGITSDARDNYLTELIGAVYGEWETVNGIRLNAAQKASVEVIDLVADVVAYKYQREGVGLPPNLRLRLNNLYVKYAGLPLEPEPELVGSPIIEPEPVPEPPTEPSDV